MIQRIQSIYLLLAAICSLLCFYVDFASWGNPHAMGINACKVWSADDAATLGHPWGIMVFTFLSMGIALKAIFSYKNRRAQMKMTKAVIWLVLFNYIAIGAYTYTYFTRLSGGTLLDIRPGIAFPLFTAIFAFLAYRGIRRDDELVRSADRIR